MQPTLPTATTAGYEGAMDAALGLLNRWRAGDQAAGEELFGLYFAKIYRFFARKLNNPDKVEDLTQDTFVAALNAQQRFAGKSSFQSYLFGIAKNKLYAHWRAASKAAEVDFAVSSLCELARSAGSVLANEEQLSDLLAALEQLPLEQQLLLELHYWQEMNASALAEVFDIAETTARTRLHRARRALRTELENHGNGPTKATPLHAQFTDWSRSLRSVGP